MKDLKCPLGSIFTSFLLVIGITFMCSTLSGCEYNAVKGSPAHKALKQMHEADKEAE